MCLYSHKSASLFPSALCGAPVFVLLIFVVVFAVIVVFVEFVIARRREFRRPERLRFRKAFYDVVCVENVSAFALLRVDCVPLFLFAKQLQVVPVLQLGELYALLLLEHHDLDLLYELRLRLVNRDEFCHI